MLPAIQSTHIILFHDKSKKYISKKAYDVIMSQIMGGVEKLNIGGNLISFSSIAKILSLEEYQKEYPQETPMKLNEFKFENTEKTETTHKQGLEGIIKGLNKYISSKDYRGTERPLELLKQMENKLKVYANL